MKIQVLIPQYVEQFPDQIDDGVLYISEEFSLTLHKCCCGCGEDVYLKLGPAKWQLTKMLDGSISLDPSVGNWKYACKSHYVIWENRVIEAGPMNARQIEAVQRRDKRDRDQYIASVNAQARLGGIVRFRSYIGALLERILKRLRSIWVGDEFR